MSAVLAVWPEEGGGDAVAASAALRDFVATVQGLGTGQVVDVLVIGTRAGSAAVLPAGVGTLRHLVHAGLALPLQPAQLLALLEPLLRERLGPADAVLFPASALGRELCARLAARLDARALGVCASLHRAGEAWQVGKALWAGRVQLALQAQGRLFAAVQPAPAPSVMGGAGETGDGVVAQVEVRSDALPGLAHVRHEQPAARRRPVEQAGIVLAGGRGMGGPAGFAQLEAIAVQLPDAAVGGSLPTVDAGWVPVSHQVGQSGKYVGPRFYVAVAISGTPQHLAGIAPFTQIVAINKDAGADIFRRARVGVVAEWQDLLPLLAAELSGNGPGI